MTVLGEVYFTVEGCPRADRASPRVAVFLQHADLTAPRRLLDWTAGAVDTPAEGFGGSMH